MGDSTIFETQSLWIGCRIFYCVCRPTRVRLESRRTFRCSFDSSWLSWLNFAADRRFYAADDDSMTSCFRRHLLIELGLHCFYQSSKRDEARGLLETRCESRVWAREFADRGVDRTRVARWGRSCWWRRIDGTFVWASRGLFCMCVRSWRALLLCNRTLRPDISNIYQFLLLFVYIFIGVLCFCFSINNLNFVCLRRRIT